MEGELPILDSYHFWEEAWSGGFCFLLFLRGPGTMLGTQEALNQILVFPYFLYLHPKQTCSSDKRKTGVLQLILSSYQPECHPSSDFQVLLTGFLATRTQLLDVDNSKFPAEADLGQDDCCLLRMWGKKLNNRCLLLSWITIWLVPLSPRPSSKHGTHWL